MLLGLWSNRDVFNLALELLDEEVFQHLLVLVGLAALGHIERAPCAVHLVESRHIARGSGSGQEIDGEQRGAAGKGLLADGCDAGRQYDGLERGAPEEHFVLDGRDAGRDVHRDDGRAALEHAGA